MKFVKHLKIFILIILTVFSNFIMFHSRKIERNKNENKPPIDKLMKPVIQIAVKDSKMLFNKGNLIPRSLFNKYSTNTMKLINNQNNNYFSVHKTFENINQINKQTQPNYLANEINTNKLLDLKIPETDLILRSKNELILYKPEPSEIILYESPIEEIEMMSKKELINPKSLLERLKEISQGFLRYIAKRLYTFFTKLFKVFNDNAQLLKTILTEEQFANMKSKIKYFHETLGELLGTESIFHSMKNEVLTYIRRLKTGKFTKGLILSGTAVVGLEILKSVKLLMEENNFPCNRKWSCFFIENIPVEIIDKIENFIKEKFLNKYLNKFTDKLLCGKLLRRTVSTFGDEFILKPVINFFSKKIANLLQKEENSFYSSNIEPLIDATVKSFKGSNFKFFEKRYLIQKKVYDSIYEKFNNSVPDKVLLNQWKLDSEEYLNKINNYMKFMDVYFDSIEQQEEELQMNEGSIDNSSVISDSINLYNNEFNEESIKLLWSHINEIQDKLEIDYSDDGDTKKYLECLEEKGMISSYVKNKLFFFLNKLIEYDDFSITDYIKYNILENNKINEKDFENFNNNLSILTQKYMDKNVCNKDHNNGFINYFVSTTNVKYDAIINAGKLIILDYIYGYDNSQPQENPKDYYDLNENESFRYNTNNLLKKNKKRIK